ncbi:MULTISPECIES: TM2 domain-containing protein [Micrococcus]|uniref:TM2 domain-containing protein n=1 Tax=Micrococcus TaxID=1269 RepID=UPI001CCFA1DB|nr:MULTISPECIES: TM2 domain-containing protein [Micrococcus]MCG7423287.1 TM2 domain-containing protein [Micrococcus sp. ACRRV]UBH24581.1 TM2 domain-containing protein [Micrococcus porci]
MTAPYRPQPQHQPQTVVVQQSRNTLIAYLLWFFLGNLGVHRMYTKRWVSGVVQLLLAWGGAATAWLLIGWIPLAIWAVWWIVDLFLVPGMVRDANAREAVDSWRTVGVRRF